MISSVADVIAKYQERHRVYHTMEHIGSMLHMSQNLSLNEAQLLAIWYHDVIYVPGRNDNEEQSAEFARRQLLRQATPVDIIERCARIIMDTKEHKPSSAESAIVLDLDMAILGADWKTYYRYVEGIRKEFKEIPDMYFYPIRYRLIEQWMMLAEEGKLFHTDFGQQFNDQAKSNLRNEWDHVAHHPSMTGSSFLDGPDTDIVEVDEEMMKSLHGKESDD